MNSKGNNKREIERERETLKEWTLVKKRVELKLQCTQVNSSVLVACLRIDFDSYQGWNKKEREREKYKKDQVHNEH